MRRIATFALQQAERAGRDWLAQQLAGLIKSCGGLGNASASLAGAAGAQRTGLAAQAGSVRELAGPAGGHEHPTTPLSSIMPGASRSGPLEGLTRTLATIEARWGLAGAAAGLQATHGASFSLRRRGRAAPASADLRAHDGGPGRHRPGDLVHRQGACHLVCGAGPSPSLAQCRARPCSPTVRARVSTCACFLGRRPL
jgi:hypothetical protein